ncbi:MAG TPA: hypothetical protein VFN26_05540 [Candidatus Acidoferrum sp.]|nr:hypothetical protein [Candidatus Acidoferrum sp.]
MRVREAKDFLVQQIAQQAGLENVPLSDLEKRMLYFTEGDDCPEDPAALNDEFDSQYDSDAFEKKITQLMKHAYKRLRKKGSSEQRIWDDAIRRLKRGDHYMLVMWDARPGIPRWQIVLVVIIFFLYAALRWGITWITRRFQPPNPHLVQAVLLVALVAIFVFKKHIADGLDWILDKTLFRFLKDE